MENLINLETFVIEGAPTLEQGVRLLKTEYRSNYDRFVGRFLEPMEIWLNMNDIRKPHLIVETYKKLWDKFSEYTYKEAFAISDQTFRAKVFSVISVPEMIKELGSKRIAVEGVELINKTFNPVTGEFNEIPMTQIYELHEVSGKKLDLNEKLYAIRCWCTSTDSEHWLWTTESRDPLKAIAECCVVYEPMRGKIKSIIRQGDVFLFEMTEKVHLNGDEKTYQMDKETYFKLLKSQS